MKRLRVISWNVNGLRACAGERIPVLARYDAAQVVGLQEVRAEALQLPAEVRVPRPAGTRTSWRQSGAATAAWASTRAWAPDTVESLMEAPHFDREGRVQIAHFSKL